MAAFLGAFRFGIFGFYIYAFGIATVYIEKGYINPANGKPYTTGDLLSVLVAVLTGMT